MWKQSRLPLQQQPCERLPYLPLDVLQNGSVRKTNNLWGNVTSFNLHYQLLSTGTVSMSSMPTIKLIFFALLRICPDCFIRFVIFYAPFFFLNNRYIWMHIIRWCTSNCSPPPTDVQPEPQAEERRDELPPLSKLFLHDVTWDGISLWPA